MKMIKKFSFSSFKINYNTIKKKRSHRYMFHISCLANILKCLNDLLREMSNS